MRDRHAAVASRVHEIGVLRSLGFARLRILLIFATEGVLLGLGGGLFGSPLALLAHDTPVHMMTTVGFTTFRFMMHPRAGPARPGHGGIDRHGWCSASGTGGCLPDDRGRHAARVIRFP